MSAERGIASVRRVLRQSTTALAANSI